jgi:hypothetical protein
MKSDKLQKKELDFVGQKLLGVAGLSENELESISTAPLLFEAVKAEIQRTKTEMMVQPARKSNPAWSWRQFAAVSAACAILLASIAGLAFWKHGAPAEEAALVARPEVLTVQHESPRVNPEPSTALPEIINLVRPARKTEPAVKAAKPPRPETEGAPRTRTTKLVKPAQRPATENNLFYPVTYTGDAGERDDLQVIRAETTRSALFVLGVNLPVENEAARVKVDLLMGSDGVIHGVRMVR